MIKQEFLELDGVQFPVIIDEGGVRYYPIRYLSEKVLLRKNGSIVSKSSSHVYEEYIKIFSVDYSFNGGGTQETKCINEDGLREVFKKFKIGRLDSKQKKRHNIINKKLEINKNIIDENERFIAKPLDEYIQNYSVYIQDAISDVLLENEDILWQKCMKCTNYYPHHINFFRENQKAPDGLDTYCRECKAWNEQRSKVYYIKVSDEALSRIYKKYGDEFYVKYRDHDTIWLYDYYIDHELTRIPEILVNKKDYLKIIKHLQEKGMIHKDNISLEELRDNFRLTQIHSMIQPKDIYVDLFGDKFYLEPWEYKNFKFGEKYSVNADYGVGREIFFNYLKYKKIKIKNMFDFDYLKIMKECKLMSPFGRDILSFVVNIHDKQYAGYKFKTNGVNYYKDKNNRMFDLKYLIEEDMKWDVEKIPLYLTVTTIRTIIGTATMYNVLKNQYNNLFEWVNEVYPDRFVEADFNIGIIRNKFDSVEEGQIHTILAENLENVIYNQRNTDNTITIHSMNPDWIVLTDECCWLIEYFGMYYERSYDSNSRINFYMNKANKKLNTYEKLEGYKKLFIYPEDLKDNYEGLMKKIQEII